MLHDSPYIWIGPLAAMLAAQILKPLLIMLRIRKVDWQRMREPGGMPSSHTALVVALVTELYLRAGGRDPVLALASFIALIVMYDAAGVRWQTGRHAAVLNRLLKDLQGNHPIQSTAARQIVATENIRRLNVVKVPWWLVDWSELNEHVGHKPTEVLGGCVVGVLVAFLLH